MPKRKINLQEIIEFLILEYKEIDLLDKKQHVKTKLFQALARRFLTKLYRDGRRDVEDKLTLKTARSYLSKTRDAIKKITGLHHRFESELSRIIKKYNRHSDLLAKLNDVKIPDEARTIRNSLLEILLCTDDLRKELDQLDFNKRTIKAKIKNLAEKYPTYAYYINNLDKKNNMLNAKVELIKTINESTSLYDELKAIKIDHELVVSLKISNKDSAHFNKDKETRLKQKKNNVVFVDYPKYMDQITTILENPNMYFNDSVSGIAPLIFALCAATGRRLIEIVFTGDFKTKGKNGLIYTGTAKKRNNNNDENLIYALIDSEIVVSALDILRNNAVTQKIITESDPREHFNTNEIIKGKISPELSAFTKDFFGDKKRVSKDTRGIYGRICHQRWYLNDLRWKNKDEDIFFFELFCHINTDAQVHYKPFKLNNFSNDYVSKAIINKRWLSLCELDNDMNSLSYGDAAIKIHNWVKNKIEKNPYIKLTQSSLVTGTSSFRGTIKKYLDFIGELALPGEPLTTQGEEGIIETDEPKKQKEPTTKEIPIIKNTKPPKPHLNAKQLKDNNHWEVLVKLEKTTTVYDLYASGKVAAMKKAYALFTKTLFKFKVTIPFKEGPAFQEVIYAKTEGIAKTTAIHDARLDGYRGEYNQIQVVKIKS